MPVTYAATEVRGITRSAALCAAVAAAVVIAAAATVSLTGLADEARVLLGLDFAGVERSPTAAASIAIDNGRIAAGVLLCACLAPRLLTRTRIVIDVLLAALLALNAAAVGVAFGAYGTRAIRATALHLPLEIAALSLAGGAYMQACRQPLTRRALAAVATAGGAAARRRGRRWRPTARSGGRDAGVAKGPAADARARHRARARRAVALRLDARLGAPVATGRARPRPHVSAARKAGPQARGRSKRPSTPSRRPCTRCSWSRSRVLLLALFIVLRRALQRRRRARATTRWELLLGRDDLANPYRVQEAFEGITGAITARWYERLFWGCDHFAVEVHRLHDRAIRFTIAGPSYLERAIQGPLEDLYPDVELERIDGEPTCANAVVRLKKRHRFVLSIQTNRNYEHAFTRVARRAALSPRARNDRPARAHARTRVRAPPRTADAQAPRAHPAARRPPRPRRARASTPSSKPKSSKAHSSCSTARCCTSTCASSAQTRRPCGASLGCSRSCALRTSSASATSGCAGALYARRTAAGPAQSHPRAATAACCRRRSWRRCGSFLARASSTHGCRARRCAARSRRPRSSATPSASCCATSAAPSRSRPPTASTATR